MILHTSTPQEFHAAINTLTAKGYIQISNLFNPTRTDNYLLITPLYALYALTTRARADKDGYTNYQDSQFIKNLKK